MDNNAAVEDGIAANKADTLRAWTEAREPFVSLNLFARGAAAALSENDGGGTMLMFILTYSQKNHRVSPTCRELEINDALGIAKSFFIRVPLI